MKNQSFFLQKVDSHIYYFLVFVFSTGLFSVIMRDMANLTGDAPKWIVLDGDIDPMWIESLNTVMDDNKVHVYFNALRY